MREKRQGRRDKRNTVRGSELKRKIYPICAIILTTIIVLINGLYLHYEWNRYQEAATSEAIQLAQSLKALMHPEHIAELSGSSDDLAKEEYVIIKRSLTRLVEETDSIRFAYLFDEGDGNIIILLDSESPDSPDYSPPGQIYYEAMDAYWQPFMTGSTVLTDPITDRWGVWISALSPIKDPNSGDTVAVLGIDYDAAEWRAAIWGKMVPDFLVAVVVLLLYLSLLYIAMQQFRLNNLNQKLASREAFYRGVFEQAPIGIAIMEDKNLAFRPELGAMSVNTAYEKILGRDKIELCNRSWVEITHPDDLKTDMDLYELFKSGENEGYKLEKRFVKPDGSVVWTNMLISRLYGMDHEEKLHLCILEDLSERKKTELALKESERRQAVLLAHLPGLAYRCRFDWDGTMLIVSDGCYNLTGYAPDCFINNRDLSFNDIITPQYREILYHEWERAVQKKVPYQCEYEITTAGGQRKWVLEMGQGSYDEQGDLEALEGIIIDITERKNAEEQRRLLLERTQSMFNEHEAVMLLIDPLSGTIIEANQAASNFYGYSREELLRMKIQDINSLDSELGTLMRMKALNKEQRYFTFPHKLKNGETRIVDVYSCPIEYDGTKVLFSIIFDVTTREETAKQNEFLAYHDYLTGLYNRRFFEEEFSRRVIQEEFPVAFLIGDVNGFKVLNDTFGHAEGDRVLKEIADTIAARIGEGDMLARIGGDEFAIIVSGKSEREIRRYLDMLEKVSDNILKDPASEKSVTISWGYGIQRQKEDTVDKLHEEAEAFMYNRKFYSYKSSRSKTVDIIMETLFTKSEREKIHSERVGVICESIAQKLCLSNPLVDKFRVAGFLHDIGKIGIDEAVLNKTGKLDQIEWELMKLHPAKGAGILGKTKEYNDIADIILSHHERYDGLGYPRGLKADSIPLGARIIAVADTYDAITNERPYRKAMSREEAIQELQKYSGTQFDPHIVEVFINEVMDNR